jgi:hypothetical protein
MPTLTEKIFTYKPETPAAQSVYGFLKGMITSPVFATSARLSGYSQKKNYGDLDRQEKAEAFGFAAAALATVAWQYFNRHNPAILIPPGFLAADILGEYALSQSKGRAFLSNTP